MTDKEVWEDRPYTTKEDAWKAITEDYGSNHRLLTNMRKAGLTITFSVKKKGTKFYIVLTIKGR